MTGRQIMSVPGVLDLPNSLRGKVNPDQVWSGDPSQYGEGTVSANGDFNWSGLAPAMTVVPYAIANWFSLQTTVDWTGIESRAGNQLIFFLTVQFS